MDSPITRKFNDGDCDNAAVAAYLSGNRPMTPLESIREYYGRIDRRDMDWILNLFTENAVYVRAESRYVGRQRIERFFRCERKIQGRHEVSDLHAVGNRVFVRSEFIGEGAVGDTRRVKFIDIWFFADDGAVDLRETYLALGHLYVNG